MIRLLIALFLLVSTSIYAFPARPVTVRELLHRSEFVALVLPSNIQRITKDQHESVFSKRYIADIELISSVKTTRDTSNLVLNFANYPDECPSSEIVVEGKESLIFANYIDKNTLRIEGRSYGTIFPPLSERQSVISHLIDYTDNLTDKNENPSNEYLIKWLTGALKFHTLRNSAAYELITETSTRSKYEPMLFAFYPPQPDEGIRIKFRTVHLLNQLNEMQKAEIGLHCSLLKRSEFLDYFYNYCEDKHPQSKKFIETFREQKKEFYSGRNKNAANKTLER